MRKVIPAPRLDGSCQGRLTFADLADLARGSCAREGAAEDGTRRLPGTRRQPFSFAGDVGVSGGGTRHVGSHGRRFLPPAAKRRMAPPRCAETPRSKLRRADSGRGRAPQRENPEAAKTQRRTSPLREWCGPRPRNTESPWEEGCLRVPPRLRVFLPPLPLWQRVARRERGRRGDDADKSGRDIGEKSTDRTELSQLPEQF